MPASSKGIAVLGGTFDPVHVGHLRSALEVGDRLAFRKVRLVPSFVPPHRTTPLASAAHRLAMLRCATRDSELLEVDDRELRREGTSYTVDTLREIRAETGEPVALVVGEDQFRMLNSWFEWRQLPELAHIVVLERPGVRTRGVDEELTDFAEARWVDDPLCLQNKTAGMFCRLRLTQLDVSATLVRKLLSEGRSIEYLVPQSVISYIQQNGLYGTR